MSSEGKLTARLGIDHHELEGVRLLFLHNFLQGLGIAFFSTASISMFLHDFKPEGLALSFVLGGIAMLITSRVYAHFEHNLPLRRFLPGAVLFLSATALIAWLSLYTSHSGWIIFALFLLFRVHYLVSNLEFWGLTALLYNVRQGKRLFGLIGAADIPAKVIGFLSVYILVPIIGEQHLLACSAIFFAGSYFVVRRLVSNHGHGLDHGHGHGHGHHGLHGNPDKFLLRFFGNRFILRLSVFAMLVGIALVLIEFSFYGEVKLKFKKSADLSTFLSLFLGGVMTLTFLVKLLFSGKMLLNMGMRTTLLVFVIFILVCSTVILFLPIGDMGLKAFLACFAALYGLRDTLRFALYDPAFLSLFQPLSPQLRLKGHTVIKGVVDAIGMIVAGVVLLAMIYLEHHPEPEDLLFQILLCISALLAASIPALFVAHKEWLVLLQHALRKRFLDGGALQLGDRETVELIRKRLESDNAGEVEYALRLLEASAPAELPSALLQCLRHKEPTVVLYAINKSKQLKLSGLAPALEPLVNSVHPELRRGAIHLLSSMPDEWRKLDLTRLAADPDLLKPILEGLLSNPDEVAVVLAKARMAEMLQSDLEQEVIDVLHLHGLYQISLPEPVKQVIRNHPSQEVRKGARICLMRLGDIDTMEQVLRAAVEGNERQNARKMLLLAGDHLTRMPIPLEPESLILICRMLGKTPTKASQEYLLQMCSNPEQAVRTTAVEALMEQGYKATGKEEVLLMEHLKEAHGRIQKLQVWLQNLKPAPEARPVCEALEIELAEEASETLSLIACLTSVSEVRRALQGLRSHNPELRADGIEAIDHLMPSSFRSGFTFALEQIYLHRSVAHMPAQSRVAPGIELRRMLASWDVNMHAWTLASIVECLALHYPTPAITDADLPKVNLPPLALDALVSVRRQHPEQIDRLFSNTKLLQKMSDHHTQVKTDLSTLSLVEKVIFLRNVSLFEGTPDNVLAEVAAVCREERIGTGDKLITTGQEGSCMYILVTGTMSIQRQGHQLAKFGPGDFFGELSLIESEMRTADAIALEDGLLLRIDQDDFFELIEDRPEVMQAMMVTLARRIRKQNEVISELKKEGAK